MTVQIRRLEMRIVQSPPTKIATIKTLTQRVMIDNNRHHLDSVTSRRIIANLLRSVMLTVKVILARLCD